MGQKKPPVTSGKTTPPEAALRAYIERVRAQQAAEVRTTGFDLEFGGQAGEAGDGCQGSTCA